MDPKISIIVPIYNAEKTLHRCINSIICQSYQNWELLLIDDGSTDNSSVICDEYVRKDERIRVFHKENGGVSSARNVGLDNVKGEWITFVDSDDWIENEMFDIFNLLVDTDFICCYYIAEGWKEWVSSPYKNKIYRQANMSDFLTECLLKSVFICGKFYKKEIIKKNKMYFDTNISYSEDTLFIYQYICYIKSVRTFSEAFYHYDKNESSLSNRCEEWGIYSYTLKRELDVINQLGNIFQWNPENVRNETTLFFVNRYVYYLSKNMSFCEIREKLKIMLQTPVVSHAIKKNTRRSWKGKILDWLMLHDFLWLSASLLYMKKKKIIGK